MIFAKVIRKLIRRPFFKGQYRIFSYLFKKQLLQIGEKIVSPITGNFKVNCNTATWIGASVFYTGEYEPYLKKIFRSNVYPGNTVLDIGANIGFHTLYFAELTGPNGKVMCFEPIPINFQSLINNINLNKFTNIYPTQIALGNKNEQVNVFANMDSINPGSFNLFETGGDITINCRIGDEVIDEERIDLIKIDVEGYECFVLEGLMETIKRHKPKIIFEYDRNYQLKTGMPENHIFELLGSLGYVFYEITFHGVKKIYDFIDLDSSDVLATYRS